MRAIIYFEMDKNGTAAAARLGSNLNRKKLKPNSIPNFLFAAFEGSQADSRTDSHAESQSME